MDDKIVILLVEDNPADVDLTKENLDNSKILHELHIAVDGIEALAFLRNEKGYENAPRPDNPPAENG